MADAKLQDDELVKAHLRNHDRLVTLRAPWEGVWQEIDERVNPLGAGGFTKSSVARVAGAGNFDVTAVEGLDRFVAAMMAITLPYQSQYIKLRFGNPDLDKLPEVRRWCERTGDRLYAMRYAPHTGFGVQAAEDMRSLGSYGTGALWTGERKGVGLFYKSIHLSELYIDEDFAGRIDTAQRRYSLTARQCQQQFGPDALTAKMRDAVSKQKLDEKFELLHVVCPNGDLQPDALDRRSMAIDSIHIAIDEKAILRRSGYHSMPISVSRHVTGPGDIWGRSPAIKVLPTIKGLNAMARTNMRAAQKMVDPALAFYDDDGITSLVTRPGGSNPGLMNERGQILVAAMPSASNLPVGLEMVEGERQVVRTAFLEDYFKLLVDEKVQRSATAVLEIAAKQGVLIAPYANRYETEKVNPVTQRDLDLAIRAGQVEPFPAVVIEAGGWPIIEYENPLARMARADEAAGLARWIEAMAPLAQVDGGAVFDHIDTDAAAPGLADVLGVRPTWIALPAQVEAKRKARAEANAVQSGVDQFATAAGAFKDMADANATAAAA
jgi:hypothetical protein